MPQIGWCCKCSGTEYAFRVSRPLQVVGQGADYTPTGLDSDEIVIDDEWTLLTHVVQATEPPTTDDHDRWWWLHPVRFRDLYDEAVGYLGGPTPTGTDTIYGSKSIRLGLSDSIGYAQMFNEVMELSNDQWAYTGPFQHRMTRDRTLPPGSHCDESAAADIEISPMICRAGTGGGDARIAFVRVYVDDSPATDVLAVPSNQHTTKNIFGSPNVTGGNILAKQIILEEYGIDIDATLSNSKVEIDIWLAIENIQTIGSRPQAGVGSGTPAGTWCIYPDDYSKNFLYQNIVDTPSYAGTLARIPELSWPVTVTAKVPTLIPLDGDGNITDFNGTSSFKKNTPGWTLDVDWESGFFVWTPDDDPLNPYHRVEFRWQSEAAMVLTKEPRPSDPENQTVYGRYCIRPGEGDDSPYTPVNDNPDIPSGVVNDNAEVSATRFYPEVWSPSETAVFDLHSYGIESYNDSTIIKYPGGVPTSPSTLLNFQAKQWRVTT